MVRVISVHHFTSQNVQTVEQPTACTTAPPDRFLLALMSNCIEVRDLKNNAEVLFTFPTVDEVAQICYSTNGDYVATLESKFNRQNREINFVRIYVNWNSIAALQQSKMTNSGVSLGSSECGMVQPMRARIAGRVTPTSNQSDLESLEMIEIPVKRNPHAIACCPIAGNLLILSEKTLNIYKFKVKSHDISKMKFIDFEDMGIEMELTFEPIVIKMCENYIAAMNKENMHLFKVYKKPSKENVATRKNVETKRDNSAPIDYAELLKDDPTINVNLPSILRENSLIHKHSPFTFWDKEMTVAITSSSYKIKNLIQLKLIPILFENAQRHVTEEFKTFALKPLYVQEAYNKFKKDTDGDNFFCSEFTRNLNSVACMLATQQEGYLFHFEENENVLLTDNCIAVYPFTAPVFQLVMEDYFLHTLTETGLESYTLRVGHKVCHGIGNVDNINTACPPVDDPICLVGLRPFLGVENILLSDNHLLLLANADVSPTHSVASNSSSNAVYWTLYSLELPMPKTIFNDISIVANAHRFSSNQTYCHLMNEAHMVLRSVLILVKWTTSDEAIKLVTKKVENVEDIVDVYRNSCALLGDHFIMCSNEKQYALAIPYYKMAKIQAMDVIKRVRKIQEQSNSQSPEGLVHYLKHVILDVKKEQEIDKLFSPNSKQHFLDELLKLLESHDFNHLPEMILKSKILQEYSTDKLIEIITEKLPSESSGCDEKNLCLCLLYIQKNNLPKAKDYLDAIGPSLLFELMSDHYWELLFDHNTKGPTSFSDFGDLVVSRCPDRSADFLAALAHAKKTMNLSRLIKIFLEYLPSCDDQNGATTLLQKTLERYFERYFTNETDHGKFFQEKGTNEALTLLVRSYLSRVQLLQLKEDHVKKEFNDESKEEKDENTALFKNNEDLSCKEPYLFARFRYEYLKKMPPFQIEIVSKMYGMCVENGPIVTEISKNDEADLVLEQLQAILCSPFVGKNIVAETKAFLELNENLRGRDSLKSVVLSNKEALSELIENCPQCIPQFGKDRLREPDDWQFLISLLQEKILRLSENDDLNRICFFYKKILRDTLTNISTSMTLDELMQVFPRRGDVHDVRNLDLLKEIQDYEPYVVMCKETMHANQIKQLIVTTGQQLLCTLNL